MSRIQPARALAVVALFAAVPSPATEPDLKTQNWVERVILRGDFFEMDDQTGTRKWVKTPKLSIFGGTPAQQKTVAQVVQSLNELFKQTPLKEIELGKPDDAKADIKLHLVARDKLADVAGENNVPANLVAEIRKEKWSRFVSLLNNEKRELTCAVIGLASDPGSAGQLEHNVLRGLLWACGFANTSPAFKDSIFWREKNQFSTAAKLSERDRKLIVWFYNHVPPDSKSDVVHQMMVEHWDKPKKQ